MKINYTIEKQGAVILGNAYLVKKEKSLIAFRIESETKYIEVSATFSFDDDIDGIELNMLKHGCYYDKALKGISTRICFPDFKGWEVFAAEASKDVISICLIRRDTMKITDIKKIGDGVEFKIIENDLEYFYHLDLISGKVFITKLGIVWLAPSNESTVLKQNRSKQHKEKVIEIAYKLLGGEL